VIEYLRTNIERDVRIAELAALVNLSPFHFARNFRNAVGQPPYRYQIMMRMHRARDLLINTRMSVIEIALAVGYDTPQAFSRTFRQWLSVSPSAYRQRMSC